jgi:hypothetical protein
MTHQACKISPHLLISKAVNQIILLRINSQMNGPPSINKCQLALPPWDHLQMLLEESRVSKIGRITNQNSTSHMYKVKWRDSGKTLKLDETHQHLGLKRTTGLSWTINLISPLRRNFRTLRDSRTLSSINPEMLRILLQWRCHRWRILSQSPGNQMNEILLQADTIIWMWKSLMLMKQRRNLMEMNFELR